MIQLIHESALLCDLLQIQGYANSQASGHIYTDSGFWLSSSSSAFKSWVMMNVKPHHRSFWQVFCLFGGGSRWTDPGTLKRRQGKLKTLPVCFIDLWILCQKISYCWSFDQTSAPICLTMFVSYFLHRRRALPAGGWGNLVRSHVRVGCVMSGYGRGMLEGVWDLY